MVTTMTLTDFLLARIAEDLAAIPPVGDDPFLPHGQTLVRGALPYGLGGSRQVDASGAPCRRRARLQCQVDWQLRRPGRVARRDLCYLRGPPRLPRGMEAVMPAHKIPLEVRFWEKVDKSGDCWLWTGARHPLGYGHIKIDGKVEAAYRVSYEMACGPIPEGLVIDHLCRVPACVNPTHLEAVTMIENTMRGEGYMAQHARKTHCPQGHEYNETNTNIWNGWRHCRTCNASR